MILLSPGIAQGCFALLETAAKYALPMAGITASFSKFGSVESKVVLATAQDLNWLSVDDLGVSVITPTGYRLLSVGSYRQRLRQSLLDYVEMVGPPWVEHATYGRRRVISFAPPQIQQMLAEAGLSDGVEDDVVDFWDAMAARARGQRNDGLTAIGRQGERLTIAYEKQRTGRAPKWVSIDSNDKGYDVLSVISPDDYGPCTIEVKASTMGFNGSFHITRNEWDKACEAMESHRFHLWDVSGASQPSLAIATHGQMAPHIPVNSGHGSWESVEVPMRAFESLFTPMKAI